MLNEVQSPESADTRPRAALSRRTFLGGAVGASAASALVLAGPYTPVHAAPGSSYVLQWDRFRQTILGLGFEIQSDSIGSGNLGLPEATTSVPHDLTSSERTRLCTEMLRAGTDRGFRYCRLALGLYLRGLTADQRNIVGRWPEQMAELREMVAKSKVEGMAVEYWSPTPYWKSTNSYVRGTLKSGDQDFLSEFADALVQDVRYLEDNGLPVSWWCLQNEPYLQTSYSSCEYSDELYHAAFRTTASRIRSEFPHILIHATSHGGQFGRGGAAIRSDDSALALVDGWTWHRIGADSNEQLPGQWDFSKDAEDRAVYNNEFEYLSWGDKPMPWYPVNTAQSIMNWMTFHDSPTWIWLHALKPTYNAESVGYSLGFWRPWDDDDFSHFPELQKGHWTWNPMNWNGLSGFLRHMPWDAVRIEVDEPTVRPDHRIMAWIAPGGQRTFVLTNRTASAYTFHLDVGDAAAYRGSRYGFDANAIDLDIKSGPTFSVDIPAYSIEFWTEEQA
ncbi:glycoside hydrolase family 30 beta sandwich domain-containing protein [Agromyces sp. NPDC058104]|uniref:glycoside hydrolase family 30 beta sandwich domain-containing protein n=1 Tax=Agromyces sp. NPDC058104 TaxID=3346342 RepID=UPI0036DF99A7